MLLALKEVREGRMSQRQASKVYSVPRTTLIDKLCGRRPEICRTGPPPAITVEDEEMFSQHVKKIAEAGFIYTRKALLQEVKNYLDAENRIVKQFKDNMPGNYQIFSNLK